MTGQPRDDRHIPDLVTLHEAADIMGITRQAAHKMVTSGRLPGRKIGTAGWVFRRVVAERFKKPDASQPVDQG